MLDNKEKLEMIVMSYNSDNKYTREEIWEEPLELLFPEQHVNIMGDIVVEFKRGLIAFQPYTLTKIYKSLES